MSSSKPKSAAADVPGLHPLVVVIVAWLVPGAAHAWLGQFRKAVIFFIVLTGMFACGLWFGGRLFSFQTAEPLVLLAGVAEWGLGLPRLIAGVAGAGAGEVTAASYEYGNTFLMASGLLNALVVLNAFDRAAGRDGQ